MKKLTIDPQIKRDHIGYRKQAIVIIKHKKRELEWMSIEVKKELYLAQDDFIIRISDLDMHPDLGTGGSKSICPGIIQLNLEQKSAVKPDENCYINMLLGF